jgi:PKD repeat protein
MRGGAEIMRNFNHLVKVIIVIQKMRFQFTNRIALCLFGWIAIAGFQAGNAQHRVCGTDELHEQMLQDPRYRQAMEEQEQRYQAHIDNPTHRVSGVVRKIPVVVHFIQSSDIELVSDAEVQTQISVLNEDFRKMANTPGFGGGVDTEYEFCLATIDPNGCPTTGINRVISPQWTYHEQADAVFMKGLIQWNPRMYFNIWVPRTIETANGTGQVIGYATFPFSLSVSPNLDGVVIHSDYFGRNSSAAYQGETTVHEAGHWLGLFHTFQNGCQGASAATCTSQGDRVCDTPQAAAANFGCPSINSCTDTPTDFVDQIENYMDYSDGTCTNMFTQGQKDRIDFYCTSIRTQLWSAANLTATGCDGTVSPGCVPVADFQADNIVACVGQPVLFTDMSSRNPTSWSWTFTGGSPATSTTQTQSVVYNTPGTYDVVLVSTNGIGPDTEFKIGYVTVVDPSPTVLQQGFEGILSLPQGWLVTDNHGLNTWELALNASSEGQNSMKVKNFDARNAGEAMSLHSNAFSMANVISGFMTFDHSYKKLSGLTAESMKLHISTDCGTTWTTIWSKVGPYLATVAGNAAAAEFVPTLPSHWVSDTVSLDSFAGEPNVKVRFEVLANGGQSVYLDNINMHVTMVGAQDPAAIGLDFSVAPNPFQDQLRILYTLKRASTMDFALTDVQGRLLWQVNAGMQAAGSHQLEVMDAAFKNLPAGLYFLKGIGATGSMTRKIVKLD